MMNIFVCDNQEKVAEEAYKLFAEALQDGANTFGFATGSTPLELYKKIISGVQDESIDLTGIFTFNLDEYSGLKPDNPNSYRYFMEKNLFNKAGIKQENVHFLNGVAWNPTKECERYENEIRACGGIDFQILGIGRDGHIAFNEPGTSFDSRTHLAKLSQETIMDNARFFGDRPEDVPVTAFTMGLQTIMECKRIVLLATGANKLDAIWKMIHGEITEDCPASILRRHPNVTIILDDKAFPKFNTIKGEPHNV